MELRAQLALGQLRVPCEEWDRVVQEPSATLLLTPGRVGREDIVVGRALFLDKLLPGGAWLGIGAPGPVTLMCRCHWIFSSIPSVSTLLADGKCLLHAQECPCSHT